MTRTIGLGFAKKQEMLFLALNFKYINRHEITDKIIKYSNDIFQSDKNIIEIFQTNDFCVPFLITLEHLEEDAEKYRKDNIGHLSFSMNIQTPLKTNKVIEALKEKEFDFLKKDLIQSIIDNGTYDTVFDDTYNSIKDVDNFKEVFVLGKKVIK